MLSPGVALLLGFLGLKQGCDTDRKLNEMTTAEI